MRRVTTDITELTQREKFEAWFVNDVVGADVNFPVFKDGEYTEGEIYDEQLYFMLQAMWMAWKAAGAELVEALEKSHQIAPAPVVPEEMTPEMMRAVQLNSKLGEYAASNLSGAYDLFAEFWKVARRAAMLNQK